MKIKKITTAALLDMKKNGEKITALTAYDAAMAKILNASQIEIVLVGDSVGNVKLGYENTIPVTLEEMLHHTKAVKRGNSFSLLVTDMPYLTYQLSIEQAKVNAGRLIKEGGAEAVKLEGGLEVANTIKALVEIHIPVMGHLGLTPQSIHQIGGYKIQGTTQESKEKMVRDAKISVPTIGIGAGSGCDGQILVSDDLLGLTEGHVPKFVKQYADLKVEIYKAVRAFKNEVKTKRYPCSSRP